MLLPPCRGILHLMNTKEFTTRYSRSFTAAVSRTGSLSKVRNIQRIDLSNIKRNHFVYALLAVLFIGTFLAGRFLAPNSGGFASSGDIREDVPAPVATQELNKSFSFPLLDQNGKEVAKIQYTLESANLQDAFVYQGKLAKAVKGRTFLIFNLKITNPYDKTIQINSKDYLRVRMGNSNEQLAPEIHNDPVEIQANSTKYTRIGLPINDTEKNINVTIGELNGKKETVSLNLSR